MDKDYFSHQQKKEDIKKRFLSNGWITVYDDIYRKNDDITESFGVYSYIIKENLYTQCIENTQWDLRYGEGRCAVYGDNTYSSFSSEGIEPILYVKCFNIGGQEQRYIDISEEFVAYFNLYEKVTTKQNRTYYYVNNCHDLEEIVVVNPDNLKIKQSFLLEYIAMRRMHLVICFDFKITTDFDEAIKLGVKCKEEKFCENGIVYNHIVEFKCGIFQSWLMGKSIVKHLDIKDTGCHLDVDNRFVDFIVGYDNSTGKELSLSCCKSNENIMKVTFFKKEVLDKYYLYPQKYKISKSNIQSTYFFLEIDNDHDDYIPVFLTNLSMLPYNEQMYWRQYNIPPSEKMGLSKSCYDRMIGGNWKECSPEVPDLFFKDKYKAFTDLWITKFGQALFKPLSPEQEYVLNALHIPSTDNMKEFGEQIQSLALILIDSINDKFITKDIDFAPKDGSITKLANYLQYNNKPCPQLISFLKNLQSLRSGLTTAHRYSKKKSKDANLAMKFFNINPDYSNLREVATNIFMDAVYVLNTLEYDFLKD